MKNVLADSGTASCRNQFLYCSEGEERAAYLNAALVRDIEDWSVPGIVDAIKIVFHDETALMIDDKEVLVCENEKTLHAVLGGESVPEEKAHRHEMHCSFSVFHEYAAAAFPRLCGDGDKMPRPL